jgi:hypothetical protein
MKKISTIPTLSGEVRVYRDAEWDQFVARVYRAGVHHEPADAFDDDKESILGTARAMADFENKRAEKKSSALCVVSRKGTTRPFHADTI